MKTKTKSHKPKKVVKEEIVEQEIKEEIGAVKEVVESKRDFIYGDFITDTHTGKTFIYHGQNCVKENLNRYILLAPNL